MRQIILVCLSILLFAACSKDAANPAAVSPEPKSVRPNIVFVLVDDLAQYPCELKNVIDDERYAQALQARLLEITS